MEWGWTNVISSPKNPNKCCTLGRSRGKGDEGAGLIACTQQSRNTSGYHHGEFFTALAGYQSTIERDTEAPQ